MLNPAAIEFIPLAIVMASPVDAKQSNAIPIKQRTPASARAKCEGRWGESTAAGQPTDLATILHTQLSADMQFDEVMFDHNEHKAAVSSQSSIEESRLGTTTHDIAADDNTPSRVRTPEDRVEGLAAPVTGTSSNGSDGDPLEKAQQELDFDAPVQSFAETVGSKVSPKDFEILRVVGQGAFGKVFQVRHTTTQRLYAMKVMRKGKIMERDHAEYVKAERDLLTAVLHPYIVTLRFSFQTSSKLYLVLDFMNGGHLFFNLYRQGVFGEDLARLYTAEIVSAISYLHSMGIVHRDLKPENVLLDSDGHIRITDFGLAKGNMNTDNDRTNSFIGTMEYMAPEIVQGKGHGKVVDWWSTGILLYEMLCGMPPFRAKSRNALQTQILTSKVKYPKFLSTEAQNLLKGLLARDPIKRLGYGEKGSENVRKHPFFKKISWTQLENRQIESTFKPMIRNSLSVENFDKIWTDQAPEDSPCGTPTNASTFENFTYVAPHFITEAMDKLAIARAE